MKPSGNESGLEGGLWSQPTEDIPILLANDAHFAGLAGSHRFKALLRIRLAMNIASSVESPRRIRQLAGYLAYP